MKSLFPKTFLLGISTALSLGTANGQTTLFADNFDRPDDTDLNASTAGQSGIVSPLNWFEKGNSDDDDPVIFANTLAIGEDRAGGGWSIASPDYNFIDNLITVGGGFTVSVDIAGLSTRGGTRFSGFAVGHSKAEVDGWDANNPDSFGSDFFFGLDNTNAGPLGFYTYENGIQKLLSATVPDEGVAALSVNFTGFSDFSSGTTVSYEVFIDGISTGSGTFNWSGTDENYLVLYSNFNSAPGIADNQAIHDNFEVSAFASAAAGPVVTSIEVSENSARLVFKGFPGTDYYCAASPNLMEWTTELVPTEPIGSPFQTDEEGDLTFSVDLSELGSSHFLRVQEEDPNP